MDTARLSTQFPFIMGLISAALMLIFLISLSPFFTSCCYSAPYSFPAIKSMCVEYICSMWSFLHQQRDLFSSRNLFLLVNVIVLVLLINLHLQQRAASGAPRKKPLRRKKQNQSERLIENSNGAQISSLANDHAGLAAAAAMAKEALASSERAAEADSEEIGTAEPAPVQVSDDVQTFSAVDSGLETEQIVLGEDGRLRLICGPTFPREAKGRDAGSSENERLGLVGYGDGADDAEEGNGQLGLSEAVNGADAEEEVVAEEVGQLRSIPRAATRPRKSHSTGDKNVDEHESNPHPEDNRNYDTHTRSFSHSHYDIQAYNLNNSPGSIDYGISNSLSDVNNGTLVIDLSSSPSIPQELEEKGALAHSSTTQISSIKEEAAASHHSSSKHRNPSLRRTSSRPMRAKSKSDTIDATWKAINSSRGNSGRENKHLVRQSSRDNSKHLVRQSSRDNKHLIRQSSRQEFKPSGSRSGRASNKVRREPSISQDELNAKVENFIARFNEQIRIQRQQSILSYMQMVDRGS